MARKKRRKSINQMLLTKSTFEVLPDGVHAHKIETPYGTIVYTYSPKTISSILGGIFTTLLGRAYYNQPLDFQKLIEISEDETPYRSILHLEPDLLAAQEKHSEYAFELLQSQAPRLLVEASEQLIQEVIFRTLRELQDQGHHKLNHKISELLKILIDDINEGVRQRVNAPSSGGSKPDWTPERKEAFLTEYERAREDFKDAKRIYRQNKDKYKWKDKKKLKDLVTLAYPHLSDFFDRLKGEGKTAEPNVFALEYAAGIFKVEVNEYLPKVLIDARKRRREKTATEK